MYTCQGSHSIVAVVTNQMKLNQILRPPSSASSHLRLMQSEKVFVAEEKHLVDVNAVTSK